MSKTESKKLQFDEIEKGSTIHYIEGTYVFKDENEWKKHYQEHHDKNTPTIDFSIEMVIAEYHPVPHPGYSIKIEGIIKKPSKLELMVDINEPKPGKKYIMMLATAYDIVKTDKTDKKVVSKYSSK